VGILVGRHFVYAPIFNVKEIGKSLYGRTRCLEGYVERCTILPSSKNYEQNSLIYYGKH
jgi:hypothetical protein